MNTLRSTSALEEREFFSSILRNTREGLEYLDAESAIDLWGMYIFQTGPVPQEYLDRAKSAKEALKSVLIDTYGFPPERVNRWK